ncbi:hypothetical protein MHYP_G00091510 [Metynnis hypsauchen]
MRWAEPPRTQRIPSASPAPSETVELENQRVEVLENFSGSVKLRPRPNASAAPRRGTLRDGALSRFGRPRLDYRPRSVGRTSRDYATVRITAVEASAA